VAEQGRSDRARRGARQQSPQRSESPARIRRSDKVARPGLARPRNEPPVPEDADPRSLHASVRAELRSLPKDLAEIVAAHLVAAGRLIDDDPELAYAHAEAARRRAARLPIVREAAAETAYAAGRYDVALSEFRALRRMTGSQDYLPVMADCERALGRPHNALKLAREADRLELDPALRVEMIIVEAGARRDLGQDPEARRILERAVEQARPEDISPLAVARLRYAYADALLAAGREPEARQWFAAAATLDHDQETDAQQRLDELDGLLIDYDENDDTDSQSVRGPGRSDHE
jgi:tetratricopeptide (TPR) repeat protein